MAEKIRGYLKLIVFESNNGYRICKFQLENDKTHFIFIKGFLSTLQPEQLYELQGNFVYNERYGENFEVKEIHKLSPRSNDEVLKYLTSSLFPTIGEKAAQIIIDYYQTDVITKIKENLSVLHEIPGISVKQVNIIAKVFKSMSRDDELNHQFNQKGLSLQVLSLLKTKYNVDQIYALLKKDPYLLLLKDNIAFKTIDKIYLAFEQEPFTNIRICYYAWYLAKEFCNNNGDTYLTLNELTKILQKNFPFLTKEQLLAGLKYSKEIKLLIFKDDKIYVAEIYHSEINIAAMLVGLNTIDQYDDQKLTEELEKLTNKKQITYNINQTKAIKAAVHSNFLVIIGGPGTGKTTVVDGIVSLLKKVYQQSKIVLAAPTGKAAKRLREKTGQKALTIHKLLKYDALTNQFFYNGNNPLENDILILDEVSMVDSLLLSQIAKASVNLRKLILIGDPNQLPSVACGDLLRDIIQSDIFNVIKLEEVYRQEAGNDILELSYAIEQEHFEGNNLFDKKDFTFINETDSQTLLTIVGNLYQKLSDEYGADYNAIQVIAPMYNGPVGINTLNTYLQNRINHANGQKEIEIGHRFFRVNDKVMQLKNRPELEIYNGDVGIIVDIKKDKNLNDVILVKYDNVIAYSKELYYDITLAYACSVHKLQGSEYDNIIFVITKSFWMMLKRNLIYTAITRAKTKLYLIGEPSAFLYGVNNLSQKRRTTLQEKIKTFLKEQ
ncbi:SF1B family DNA helicase RecD2 [Spiroplasma endosymbiont of Ammophila pubescens]|uniref:SF1B family DNA helicase RecD2 n=1 Tax=Spiroplasma endosymbiont of Ammophila pubescens TaxID=3066315 RepID=UPI0032B1FDDB